MGMTITEKILAAHCGQDQVTPGELINAKLDFLFANDTNSQMAIGEFHKMGAEKVFDPDRVALIPDHFTPNKDIKAAEQSKCMREFAKEQGLHYFEVGRLGIEHCLLPEEGLILPGDCIVGADSHTCTHGALGAFATGVGLTDIAGAMATGETWFRVPEQIKFAVHGEKWNKWVYSKDLILYIIGKIGVDGALYQTMEFTGKPIEGLSMEARFTMCNMAVEAGAKNGIIAPDEKTLEYVKNRAKREYKFYQSDPDARYVEVIDIDIGDIEPQIAFPHLPSNTRSVVNATGVTLDQVVLGSCTNGRIEDLRIAAAIMKGKTVNDNLRMIILPGSQRVYRQALTEGVNGGLHRRGRGHCSAHLRPVPRRTHGYTRKRRTSPLHHEPQFRWAHGPLGERSVSLQPGNRRCFRDTRPHR